MRDHVRVLVRHFVARFYENDLDVTITKIAALLAAPGILIPLLLMIKYSNLSYAPISYADAASRPDKCFFILFSMIVMGFVTVLQWEALLPDRTDYVVLGALPVRQSAIFAAKVISLILFVLIFSVAVNAFSCWLYPMVASQRQGTPMLFFARMIGAHSASVLAANACTFVWLLSAQGILMNLLGARLFRRVAPYVQLVIMIALLTALFSFPALAGMTTLRKPAPALWYYPPVWFVALYDALLGQKLALLHDLGALGLRALGLGSALAFTTYAISYARHVKRSLETEDTAATGPSRLAWILDRTVLRDVGERAAFHFIWKTILRSRKHWLYLAAYAGAGFALVLPAAVLVRSTTPVAPLLSIPLVLSFFVLSGMRFIYKLPADLPANWVFQLAEDESRRRWLAGARKALAAPLVPLFGGFGLLFGAMWSWQAAVFQAAFGGVLSLIFIETAMAGFHRMPFTCSHVPTHTNGALIFAMYWFAFTTYAYSMASWEAWMLSGPDRMRWFAMFALAALAGVAAYRYFAARQEFVLEYEADPDPAVRTLSLRA